MKRIQDSYFETFEEYEDMLQHHSIQSQASEWVTHEVKSLLVSPLDEKSPLYANQALFDPSVSAKAIEDTVKSTGLALHVNGRVFPMRDTAYKSLLDRAKINGSALPKLSRNRLSDTINCCLKVHEKAQALVLIRDEKVAAVHSGDKRDYSVLPTNELLVELHDMLETRFPGAVFESGYCDHSLVCATFELPGQAEDLLDTYKQALNAIGSGTYAKKLRPAVRFQTSDVGMSSAKVSAYLTGYQTNISIGNAISVDHRHESKVSDFKDELGRLYAQYQDQVAKLTELTKIHLDYPVNAMIAACKKLSLPKKPALEAIQMFELAWGSSAGTAHDVFLALQEITYLLKSDGFSRRKIFETEEKLAGAVALKWTGFDTAKAVSY